MDSPVRDFVIDTKLKKKIKLKIQSCNFEDDNNKITTPSLHVPYHRVKIKKRTS